MERDSKQTVEGLRSHAKEFNLTGEKALKQFNKGYEVSKPEF